MGLPIQWVNFVVNSGRVRDREALVCSVHGLQRVRRDWCTQEQQQSYHVSGAVKALNMLR